VAEALQVEHPDGVPLTGRQCGDRAADARRDLGRLGHLRRATFSAMPQNQAPNRSGDRNRPRSVMAAIAAS